MKSVRLWRLAMFGFLVGGAPVASSRAGDDGKSAASAALGAADRRAGAAEARMADCLRGGERGLAPARANGVFAAEAGAREFQILRDNAAAGGPAVRVNVSGVLDAREQETLCGELRERSRGVRTTVFFYGPAETAPMVLPSRLPSGNSEVTFARPGGLGAPGNRLRRTVVL